METGHFGTHDHATLNETAGRLVGVSTGATPLSYGQRRLWFFEELEPGSPLHHLSEVVRIHGPLDEAALELSLAEIIRRHSVLRSVFVRDGSGAVQRASTDWTFELSRTDFGVFGPEQRDREVQRFAADMVARPFDLRSDLLLRANLVRLADNDHALVLVLHRIAADETSLALLHRELESHYQAFSRDGAPTMSGLPAQYADVSAWQHAQLRGEHLQRLVDFWREQMVGAPPVLPLPLDHQRVPGQRFRGAVASGVFPADLLAKIDAFSREHRTTRFLTLLAGFKALLFRYTGQDDVVVGSPLSGRTRPEAEPLIGPFTNTLVLRTHLGGDPTFLELLTRVGEATLTAGAHQELPFEKLIEQLHPQRELSHEPVCQVVFAVKERPEGLRLGEATAELVTTPAASSRNDLLVSVTEETAGLRVVAEYNADLFEPATIERLIGHFHTLLEAAAEDPCRRVGLLPVLTEGERTRILSDWNRTEVAYPKDRCIHHLFEEQVAHTPNATALIFNDTELSYAEVNRRAEEIADQLRARGAGPEVLVAICVERSLEMVIAMMAILKSGAAYVPLDPAFPKERLALMLEDTAAPVLVTQRHLATMFPPQTSVLFLDGDDTPAIVLPKNAPVASGPDNLAYVLYTSGSTGRPKGVMVRHRNAVNFFEGMDHVLGRETGVWLALTSISFDISVLEIFWTLSRGFTVLILSDQAGMKSGGGTRMHEGMRSLDEQLARHRVTHFQCTPSFARLLTRMPETLAALRPLRHFLIGGEPLPMDLADVLTRSIDGKLINMYGPTETTVWSTTHVVDRGELHLGSIPIGRPAANTQIYILDRNLQPVPVGVPGELYIGGDGVTRGYLHRSELTAEKFIVDPFSSDDARLYRTGDLARFRADGVIEFLGRVDFQVKIRGYRIELGEIEAVLAQHKDVQQCVILVREEDPSLPRLAAYILPRAGTGADAAALRDFLREKLPAHMVPEFFVFMERFPLTPTGKINRKAFPAPGRINLTDTRSAAPLTGVAHKVAAVWEHVLGIENPSVEANFFDLGGTSLQIVEVKTRLQASLGIEVPVIKLFQYPTIRSLVDSLEVEAPKTTEETFFTPIQERARRRQQALLNARRTPAEVKS